jgi:hypothetical protein
MFCYRFERVTAQNRPHFPRAAPIPLRRTPDGSPLSWRDQLTAEVSDLPCLDPNRSPNRVGQSFVGSDEDYLALDFDPVATSQVRLWKQQNRPSLRGPAYLCPGATVAPRPQRIVGRERLSISQYEIVLGPYAKHLAQPNTTIVVPAPNR